MSETLFLKLGGSLITDKTRERAVRSRTIHRLAREVRDAMRERPAMRLVLGHGSGSFGHMVAVKYATHQGVRSASDWHGFAQVAAAAAQLNQIVTDIFVGEGVPVLSLPPSASAQCAGGVLNHMDTRALHAALQAGLVPLVYGDVAVDTEWGGTIVSTESVFVYLAGELEPERILLAGIVPGVYGAGAGPSVPRITPGSLAHVAPALAGSHGADVTGGMADKVERMLALVERQPRLTVHIFSGLAQPKRQTWNANCFRCVSNGSLGRPGRLWRVGGQLCLGHRRVSVLRDYLAKKHPYNSSYLTSIPVRLLSLNRLA
jgi:isopentenyl phosphate kinase